METIRQWASKITEKQRGNFSSPLTDELLKLIKSEVLLAAPDYEGCMIALTTLHHQSIAVFYERIYPQLPKNAQQSINTALLDCANTRLGKAAACSRIAQAIQQRLKSGESAESLVPELQWYIGNVSEKTLQNNLKNIWHDCGTKNCVKLFELDVSNWQVNRLKLQNFYVYFLQMLRISDGKTDWNSIFTDFLEKNHLSDSEGSDPTASNLPTTDQQNTASPNGSVETARFTTPPPLEAPSSIPTQSTVSAEISDKGIDETADQEPGSIGTLIADELHGSPAIAHTESPGLSPESPQAEPEPEKDGVKLAELLLSWTRTQVQGTAILKSALKQSNTELKGLEDRFSSLREELSAAKKELAAKEAAVAALQHDLVAITAELESERIKSAELDGMVSKLQQMNENSAVQAVLGYKAELASALKSIVEDTRLPEAQHDAEILSALLADLLDTLHFKGIPLEEDET